MPHDVEDLKRFSTLPRAGIQSSEGVTQRALSLCEDIASVNQPTAESINVLEEYPQVTNDSAGTVTCRAECGTCSRLLSDTDKCDFIKRRLPDVTFKFPGTAYQDKTKS